MLRLRILFQVTLKHRGVGYGFTVHGPFPMRVGRVRPQGPARDAGLRSGDVIVTINGERVSVLDIKEVAERIR